jgi:hypothetical protein
MGKDGKLIRLAPFFRGFCNCHNSVLKDGWLKQLKSFSV